eukprot:3022151-Pleurochrysis_carterae.AAC.1
MHASRGGECVKHACTQSPCCFRCVCHGSDIRVLPQNERQMRSARVAGAASSQAFFLRIILLISAVEV